MPDPNTPVPQEARVPVWDVEAKNETFVPASEAEAGISAGRYNRLPQTVVTTSAPGGQQIVRQPTQAAGERQVSNLAASSTADAQARLKAFDGVLAGTQVFVNNFLDALSMGLVHDHGETADLRERAHPGAAFAGGMAAFALPGEGILGPVKNLSPLGQAEKAIGAVTKTVIPEVKAGRALKIAAGAARGALDNTALIAGYDTIHQGVDALVDDKHFSGEHIAAQIPLGLLLGGGFGAAGEFVNSFAEHEATAKALRDQDGLINPKSSVSAQVHGEIQNSIKEWDQAVERRSAQANVLRELADSGALQDVPRQYLDRVEAARDAANRARSALERVDLVGALSGGTPSEMSRAAQAVRSYEAAAQAFDHALAPSAGELGLVAPARAGDMRAVPGEAYEPVNTGHGGPVLDQAAFDLDARMADPEMRARYKDIYGKDYEFMPGNSPEELAAAGKSPLEADQANLGGQITPTSENLTNPGRRTPVQEVREPDMAPAEAEAAPTRQEPPRPEPPPAIVEKLDGGKKAKLEDGSVVWRSEHRKMVKEYEAKLADWEKNRAAGPTTKVIPRPAGGLAELNQAVEQLRPRTRVIPESFESPGSLRRTLPEATPYGKQVGEQAKIDAAVQKAEAKLGTKVEPQPFGAQQTGDMKGPVAPLRPVNSEPNARAWLEQLAKEHGLQPSPGQKAATQIEAHLARINQAAGGKLTAARALEVANSLGVKQQGTRLSDQMVQLWALRKLAGMAADVTKGESKGAGNKLIRKLAAQGVAGLGLKKFGVTGFVAGHALGYAANLGAVAGHAKLAVKQVAQMLLKNKRAAALAHGFSRARDTRSEHYGVQDADLQGRAEQIARAAADMQTTRQRIQDSLGDLADKSPDLASHITNSTLMRIQNLALRLPAFAARTGHVSVQDQRRFEEYEDATWHPEVILDAVGRGDVTPTLARALAEQHPQLQRVLTAELMADPETVQQLPNKLLRQVELITGMPLSRASDPGFLLRQQTQLPTSASAQAPDQGPPQGGGRPQAFKISAPPPTPSQAYGVNGRAPGN